MKNAQMSLAKGVFRTFPKIKKSAKLASHSGSALLPESSGCSAGGGGGGLARCPDPAQDAGAVGPASGAHQRLFPGEEEEEEEEEEEADASDLLSLSVWTSSSSTAA